MRSGLNSSSASNPSGSDVLDGYLGNTADRNGSTAAGIPSILVKSNPLIGMALRNLLPRVKLPGQS